MWKQIDKEFILTCITSAAVISTGYTLMHMLVEIKDVNELWAPILLFVFLIDVCLNGFTKGEKDEER